MIKANMDEFSLPFGRVHRVSGSTIDFDSVYQDTNLSISDAKSVVNLFFNEMTDALVNV